MATPFITETEPAPGAAGLLALGCAAGRRSAGRSGRAIPGACGPRA